MTSVAHADGDPRVPDASLRAVKEHLVRLELDGASIEGRLLGFEATSVTIARAKTNEVVTVPRDTVLRVIVIEPAAIPGVMAVAPLAVPAAVTSSAPEPAAAMTERMRVVGVQMSLLGTVVVDADYKRLRGFAST